MARVLLYFVHKNITFGRIPSFLSFFKKFGLWKNKQHKVPSNFSDHQLLIAEPDFCKMSDLVETWGSIHGIFQTKLSWAASHVHNFHFVLNARKLVLATELSPEHRTSVKIEVGQGPS